MMSKFCIGVGDRQPSRNYRDQKANHARIELVHESMVVTSVYELHTVSVCESFRVHTFLRTLTYMRFLTTCYGTIL